MELPLTIKMGNVLPIKKLVRELDDDELLDRPLTVTFSKQYNNGPTKILGSSNKVIGIIIKIKEQK